MVAGISLFFQWFGVLAFVGSIAIFIMVRKLLKKEMPTEAEKQELIARGIVNADTKKKSVWRQETQKLRYQKQIFSEVQKELEKIAEQKVDNIQSEIDSQNK